MPNPTGPYIGKRRDRIKSTGNSLGGAEWKTIDSAPKDGTHFLLFTEGYTKRWIGWFYNNAWHWDGVYEGTFPHRPTHWMLIPEGPYST